MNTLEFLETLAQETACSYGLSVREARVLVRLAMVTVASQRGVSSDRIANYLDAIVACAAPTTGCPS